MKGSTGIRHEYAEYQIVHTTDESCSLRGAIRIKYDLRYTQRPTYVPIFTDNSWSYLLWSPVIDSRTAYSTMLAACAQV